MNKKIFIGITGKSGVGKSVFSQYLSDNLDGELLSFDRISHLSLEDEEIKNKLRFVFGDQIFENNSVNRKKMGNIAFNDPEKLKILNNLSQEFMENYIDKKIKKSKKEYIIFDYALLTKMKYFDMCDVKILISADFQTRLSRIIARDNIAKDYLLLREKNLPEFDKSKFDICIENDDNLSQNLSEIAKNIAKKIQTSTNTLSK